MKHGTYQHLCPRFQAAMGVLAKPWNGLIFATLDAAGGLRFSELRARIAPLGDRMLSARLKELEARGLIERCVSPGPPVKVAYALTDVGRGFREVSEALSAWGGRFAKPTARGAAQTKRRAGAPKRSAAA